MGNSAANMVKGVHLFCIFFIVFGWAFPKEALLAHLSFLPIVVLHWWTNKGQCILTQMENRLRGRDSSGVQGEFVGSLMSRLGRAPTKMQLMIFIYSVLLVSGAASAYRLGWLF